MGTQLPVFKPLFTVLYGNYLWCICFFSKLFSFFAAHRFVSKYYGISKSWHPWLLVSKSDWCLLDLTLTYNVGRGAHKGLGKGCLPPICPPCYPMDFALLWYKWRAPCINILSRKELRGTGAISFMGNGIAGDVWRHSKWPSTWNWLPSMKMIKTHIQ